MKYIMIFDQYNGNRKYRDLDKKEMFKQEIINYMMECYPNVYSAHKSSDNNIIYIYEQYQSN